MDAKNKTWQMRVKKPESTTTNDFGYEVVNDACKFW
jgi:hypothetical protein